MNKFLGSEPEPGAGSAWSGRQHCCYLMKPSAVSRKMAWWLFLLVMMLLAVLTCSSCPPGCECNDELLHVRCLNASLEVSKSQCCGSKYIEFGSGS